MLFDFANVLVFTALGLGFVGVNLLIGKLLRPSNPQARKLSTYECGEPAMGSACGNSLYLSGGDGFPSLGRGWGGCLRAGRGPAVRRHSLSWLGLRLGQR